MVIFLFPSTGVAKRNLWSLSHFRVPFPEPNIAVYSFVSIIIVDAFVNPRVSFIVRASAVFVCQCEKQKNQGNESLIQLEISAFPLKK